VHCSARIPPELSGLRLDQAAARLWPGYSRTRLTDWIRRGMLRVDGRTLKPNARVSEAQQLELAAELSPHPDSPVAEAVPFDVLHADAHVLVVAKPAGIVVHPGSGNLNGTLVSGLLHFDPKLDALPRAGLVHRLDKNTSGCLVVARTLSAHHRLVAALKRREIHRHYKALVWGHPVSGGSVDAPLGRHPVDRRRQVVRGDGRRAVTRYRIAARHAGSTLLDVELETGRTHQIRVHMAHIGFPLVGDPVYGRRGFPPGLSASQRDTWHGFRRQALHAERIGFEHPVDGSPVCAAAPLPDDFEGLLAALRPGAESA